MQTVRMLGGLAIVLVSAWTARADPRSEFITLPEVSVRSGPSPEFYETSKLRKGDVVRVLREERTGWLAIEPPPRSFSWIDVRLVQLSGDNAAVVSGAEAQIRAGSRLKNVEPTVSRAKASRGTQLTVIGKAERASDGVWLPILPVPTEARYIPAEAIRPSAAVQQFAAAAPEPMRPISSPAPAGAGLTSSQPATAGTSPYPPPPASRGTDPLWLRADDAERAGNLVRAQELLRELAARVQQTDFELSLRCLNRIQDLQDRGRKIPSAPVPTNDLANANGGRVADRQSPSPAGSSPPAPSTYRPQQQIPSEYCYRQDPGYTARLSSPIMSAPSPPPPVGDWSDAGWLRRTTFELGGRRLFCLQPIDRYKRRIYVAAGPGVNLEPYVELNVYLYGPVVYSGDLRNNLMTVLQVRPAR